MDEFYQWLDMWRAIRANMGLDEDDPFPPDTRFQMVRPERMAVPPGEPDWSLDLSLPRPRTFVTEWSPE